MSSPPRNPEGFVYPDSRCRSLILVDQPAESIDANNHTVSNSGTSRLCRLKRQATVRSFVAVMPQILPQDRLHVDLHP